ncbi:MAG TPA: hypothetical protein VFL12_10640 [Thermoanaerobaculia bacterium]|nr:hypothetical protein [Thermoanaerobaculia bacterium]
MTICRRSRISGDAAEPPIATADAHPEWARNPIAASPVDCGAMGREL